MAAAGSGIFFARVPHYITVKQKVIMETKLYFFAIFFVTILITRIFLYFKPIQGPIIYEFRIHHYMYGIALAVAGALLGSITIYAIGLGLFVDELGFLLIRGKTHEENYSKVSLLLLVLFIILVYILKEQLLFWTYL